MKAWLISDTHFGIKATDNDKWLSLMIDYFYQWFIPTVKNKVKKGDILIHCGDLFDNRNSINVKVVDSVVKLFEELSNIFSEIHVIAGNHDAYAMSSTSINSLCVIRNISNITIHDQTSTILLGGKKCTFMPWIHKKGDELSTLEEHAGSDYLFCHSDLNGCKTQLNPTRPLNKWIPDIEDFKGYGQVWSGHIHIRQSIKNFTHIGAPYHLDRNDIGNKKGIYVLDLSTSKHLFIENTWSPEFKKVQIINAEALKALQIEQFNKDFIDLHISKSFIAENGKARLQLEKLTNSWPINEVFWQNDLVVEEAPVINSQTVGKTLKEWSIEWIDHLKFNQTYDMFSEMDLKDLMRTEVEKCFNAVQLS